MNDKLNNHTRNITQHAQSLLKTELNAHQLYFTQTIIESTQRFAEQCTDLADTHIRHDLNNSLTPLYGCAKLLLSEKGGNLTHYQKTELEIICESIAYLRLYVDTLFFAETI